MAATAPRHISSTPSGAPQSAPKTRVVAPHTTKMETRPVAPTASILPLTMADGRTGAAARRTRVPWVRSSISARMPSPLPMKRKTTAMEGAK